MLTFPKATVLLLTVLFASECLSALQKTKPLGPHSFLDRDLLFFDINDYVDLSKAVYPLEVGSAGGHAVSRDKPYFKKLFYREDYETLNLVKHITEDLTLVVVENSKVILLEMAGMGKSIHDTHLVNLHMLGGIVCEDAVLNELRNFIYVGCYTKSSAKGNGAVFVHTIDASSYQLLNTTTISQDDGFKITNKLEMFIANIPQEANAEESHYLAVYDQRPSHAEQSRGNGFIRFFRNVEDGVLKFFRLMEIPDQEEYTAIYNYFPYGEQVIISGRINQAAGVISLRGCRVDLFREQMLCGETVKPTTVSSGFVDISPNGKFYHEVDAKAKTIRVAKLRGLFTDATWNTDTVRSMKNVDLFEDDHIWINGISGNGYVAAVNYGQNTKTDAGLVFVSYETNESWKTADISGATAGKTIVWVGQEEANGKMVLSVNLARAIDAGLVIDSDYYSTFGHHVSSFSVRDSDKDNDVRYSSSSNFYFMDSIFDEIFVHEDFLPENLTINSTSVLEFNLPFTSVKDGNALTLKVSSPSGKVTGDLYTSEDVLVTFKPDHAHDDIVTVAFTHDKALIERVDGYVFFYNCKQPSWDNLACEIFTSYPMPRPNARHFKQFKHWGTTSAVWICDTVECYILLVEDDGEIYKKDLPADATDVLIMPEDDEVRVIYVSQASQNVTFLRATKATDPDSWFVDTVLTNENSGFEGNFCPSQVRTHASDSDSVYILNDCDGLFQAVLTYDVTNPAEVVFQSYATAPVKLVQPFMCPTTTGFWIGSENLISKGTLVHVRATDDINALYVPGEVLGDSEKRDNFFHSCMSNNYIVVNDISVDGMIMTTVINGELGQSTRYVSRFLEEATHTYAYNTNFGIVHWFRGATESVYKMTLFTPRVVLAAAEVEQEINEELTFVFRNGEQLDKTHTFVVRANINIQPQKKD